MKSMNISLTINGKPCALELDANTPLLYAIRNEFDFKGTRFGCGSGHCGACTVLIDGKAVQSCDATLDSAKNKNIKDIQAGFLAINKEGEVGAFAVHPGFNFAQATATGNVLIDAGSYFKP
jgi:aerobic-type carbon monoxide dehydrogenase small subunit (CoxS/CutS family)